MKKHLFLMLAFGFALFISQSAQAAPLTCVDVQVNEGQDVPSVNVYKAILPKGGCVRDVLGWSQVEQTIGTYTMPVKQWQNYQNVTAASDQNLVTLAFGNKLYGNNGYQKKLNDFGLPVTPAQIEAFKNYSVWVVSHDGGTNPTAKAANIPNLYGVSIWNELNGSWGGGIKDLTVRKQLYAKLVNVVGPAIRMANPNIKIIVGATVGGNVQVWYKQLFIQNKMWGLNDPNVYLDIHLYLGKALACGNTTIPPALMTWNDEIRNIRGYGINNSLFLLEWGGSVADYVETEEPQINYVQWAQDNIISKEDFVGTGWFQLASSNPDGSDPGLVTIPDDSFELTRLGQEFINWWSSIK